MTAIRVLLVDDEPLARERIRTLLQGRDDFEVIGECADGHQAVENIQREAPDLVFLDIRMPGLDGFEVLGELIAERCPAVVFVTAYDEHAVRAFEVNALDYLLKPYDEERFEAALDRARAQLGATGQDRSALAQQLLTAIGQLRSPQYLDRLLAKAGNQLLPVPVEEIDWIEAAGKYARLHCGEKEHLLREPFHHLEAQLDPKRFARIHRSTIVNLDRLRSLEPTPNGEYRITLHDGTELTLSRSYRPRLRERFGDSL